MKLVLKEKKLSEASVDKPLQQDKDKLEALMFQLHKLLSKTIPVEVARKLFEQYSSNDVARVNSREKDGKITLRDVVKIFNLERTWQKLPDEPLNLDIENIK